MLSQEKFVICLAVQCARDVTPELQKRMQVKSKMSVSQNIPSNYTKKCYTLLLKIFNKK